MKKAILVLLAFFVASSLHAQGARRADRPPAPATINDGATLFDVADPFAALHWHAGANGATPARPAADPVPVSQLRIPSKAVKEFERSQKAFHSGDVPTSVEHFLRPLFSAQTFHLYYNLGKHPARRAAFLASNL